MNFPKSSSKLISYKVAKGPKFALKIEKQATDLTAEMLADGSWKTQTFKKYNFAGNPPEGGHLHPLMKVREEFRKIFFELGYVIWKIFVVVLLQLTYGHLLE